MGRYYLAWRADMGNIMANEPYRGRKSVIQFDMVIKSCREANTDVALYIRQQKPNALQNAASQIIPQGINIALSIRELVRQGYLFGAAVLLRPLIERTLDIAYLQENPNKLIVWQKGWKYKERPSLAEMLTSVTKNNFNKLKSQEIVSLFNHIDHGDPQGSEFNMAKTSKTSQAYVVGRSISEPRLCDFVCNNALVWLNFLVAKMVCCFPAVRKL
jgi:hypothetical protein